MNAHTTIPAATPKAVRDGIFKLDGLLCNILDAALVVDSLNEMGKSDLAYRASNPLLGDVIKAREILSSIWDEAMGKAVAK